MNAAFGLSPKPKVFFAIALFFVTVSFGFTQSVTVLAQKTGSQVWWDAARQTALIVSDNHRLTLDPRLKVAIGDGQKIFEISSISTTTQGLVLSSQEFSTLLQWLLDKPPQVASDVTPSPSPRKPETTDEPTSRRVQVIVLDAGHGGSDPGCLGKHMINGKEVLLQEKELTLSVVLELEKLLKTIYPDRSIILTRHDDSYPTLEERVQIAHQQRLGEQESILYLSVHFNASLNKNAKGLEFWYVPQNYERDVISEKDVPDSAFPVLNAMVDAEFKKESRQLAEALAENLGREVGQENTQRGLKENPWFVVRMTRMPAVLVELGFLTNFEEAAHLQDPEYLKKLAHGLYNGLASFIRSYEGHS